MESLIRKTTREDEIRVSLCSLAVYLADGFGFVLRARIEDLWTESCNPLALQKLGTIVQPAAIDRDLKMHFSSILAPILALHWLYGRNGNSPDHDIRTVSGGIPRMEDTTANLRTNCLQLMFL